MAKQICESPDKADVSQLSNPNLLDNPWFTVNQRGQSSYVSGAARYTVDRWQASATENVVVNSDGSVTISNASESNNGFFQQYFENSLRDNLLGRAITVSAIVDGVLYNNTFVMPATVRSSYLVGYITIGDMVLRLRFSLNQTLCFYFEHGANSSNSYTIKAVKLEMGSISTLAMDTTPNYAEELLKCQRYLYVLAHKESAAYYINTCSVVDTNHNLDFSIPLPCKMRATPTVTFSSVGGFSYTKAGAVDGTDFSSVVHSYLGTPRDFGFLILRGTQSPALTSGEVYKICIKPNTQVVISAEI